MPCLSSEELCREVSECLCAACASLHFILEFNQCWGKRGHSNINDGVLVTCHAKTAVQLPTLLSMQRSGVEYSHPTENGETSIETGDETSMLALHVKQCKEPISSPFPFKTLWKAMELKRPVSGESFLIPSWVGTHYQLRGAGLHHLASEQNATQACGIGGHLLSCRRRARSMKT